MDRRECDPPSVLGPDEVVGSPRQFPARDLLRDDQRLAGAGIHNRSQTSPRVNAVPDAQTLDGPFAVLGQHHRARDDAVVLRSTQTVRLLAREGVGNSAVGPRQLPLGRLPRRALARG